jgi:prepilin-type N-terminal cleavage/methylation domain-containing protein
MSRGFTLPEVLVAALLVAIPVGSAQILMLHSASVVHGAQGPALARAAARHYVARASAFYLGGLWSESSVSPGYWLLGGAQPARQLVAVSLGKPAGNCRSIT